jgi:hypothetical protein
LIDPVGRRIMAVAPDPNVPGAGTDNNYVSVPITRTNTNQFDTRIDHTLARNITIFGRYSFVDTKLFQPAPRPGLAEGSTNDTFGTADLRSQGLALGATWVISPSIISETRLGHARGDPAECRLGLPRDSHRAAGRAHRRSDLRGPSSDQLPGRKCPPAWPDNIGAPVPNAAKLEFPAVNVDHPRRPFAQVWR